MSLFKKRDVVVQTHFILSEDQIDRLYAELEVINHIAPTAHLLVTELLVHHARSSIPRDVSGLS